MWSFLALLWWKPRSHAYFNLEKGLSFQFSRNIWKSFKQSDTDFGSFDWFWTHFCLCYPIPDYAYAAWPDALMNCCQFRNLSKWVVLCGKEGGGGLFGGCGNMAMPCAIESNQTEVLLVLAGICCCLVFSLFEICFLSFFFFLPIWRHLPAPCVCVCVCVPRHACSITVCVCMCFLAYFMIYCMFSHRGC